MGKTVWSTSSASGNYWPFPYNTPHTCKDVEKKKYVIKEFSKEAKQVLTKQCIALLLVDINKASCILPVKLSIQFKY